MGFASLLDSEMLVAKDVEGLRELLDPADLADLAIDGEPFQTEPAPMLASFRWKDGRWRLVAQGNFNLPT